MLVYHASDWPLFNYPYSSSGPSNAVYEAWLKEKEALLKKKRAEQRKLEVPKQKENHKFMLHTHTHTHSLSLSLSLSLTHSLFLSSVSFYNFAVVFSR